MAPELAMKLQYFAKKVDIWALGIILFVMILGYFPFQGKTDKELNRRICKGLSSLPTFLTD
jgi:serine/threonine protein kinase